MKNCISDEGQTLLAPDDKLPGAGQRGCMQVWRVAVGEGDPNYLRTMENARDTCATRVGVVHGLYVDLFVVYTSVISFPIVMCRLNK